MSKPLIVIIIGPDKDMPDFEDVFEAAKKQVPLRFFTADKSVQGVALIHKTIQQHKHVDAVFLHSRFSLPGKEEYSDAIRKTLQDKYPDVPIVCWGHSKKGGEQGKHYHFPLESNTTAHVVDALKRIRAGELVANYRSSKKGGASGRYDTGSASIRRKSLDADSVANERVPSSSSLRRSSFDAPAHPDPDPPRRNSMGSLPSSSNPPRDPSPYSGRQITPMLPMLNGGMGGGVGMMSGRMSNPGNAFMGMGTASMPRMGGMSPMQPMGGQMSPMMNPMMNPMLGQAMQAQQPGMGLNWPMGPGTASMPHMPSMMSHQMAPMSPQQPPTPSTNETIQMLAEEVVRLRKAVEEKRARAAAASATVMPSSGYMPY